MKLKGKKGISIVLQKEKKNQNKSKDIPKVLTAITCTAVKDTRIL